MRCGVVIVGAGQGSRLGASVRKAMVPLDGQPLLLHAARAFARHPAIAEIVLVVHPDDERTLREAPWGAVLDDLGIRKFTPGGGRRQDSVLMGVLALSSEIEGVMVHDAARPFVSADVISAVAHALDDHPAAVPCVPLTSTVKKVDAEKRVVATLDRSVLRAAQTPQGVRRTVLIDALEKARRDGVEVTDDVQAIERIGGVPLAVEDSPWNFKVTTPFDLEVAKLVLESGRWRNAK